MNRWMQSVKVVVLAVSVGLASRSAWGTDWFPEGPFGGDARSLAADPRNASHLYLGTETGWVYESVDSGGAWKRLSQVDGRSDLVIDHILTDAKDPKRLIVGAFAADRPDGGIFISEDAGKTWYSQAEMKGQSVRALAASSSDPNLLVAGTLKGVFRSNDGGKHWTRISPENYAELHEVESVALDPANPQVIYAGTWHLPWRTTDGGAHWEYMKQGIIDDSDVFSIIVDPKQPNILYASACSGIYKSVDGGGVFKGGVSLNKGQGIPSSARRTRKLMQDPNNRDTVYAGTTEGLYRTTDSGTHWVRMTGPEVIVNDVYVDPSNSHHVLLATDRGGVLRSEDGAVSFEASNAGFSSRQITAYAMDAQHPSMMYIGVVNDKATGGVFQSEDGGLHWQQRSAGLGGRDVFSLTQATDGTLLAGTGHGVFRLTGTSWLDSSAMEAAPAPEVAKQVARVPSKKLGVKQPVAHPRVPVKLAPVVPARLDQVVYALAGQGGVELAGTSDGLFRSVDNGTSWVAVKSLQLPEARFVAVQGALIAAAGLRQIALSSDKGETWSTVPMPTELSQVAALAVDDHKNLWVGGREGVFYSPDAGANWKTLRNLFVNQVDNLYFDEANHRVLVTALDSTIAFAAHVPEYNVTYWQTGWKLRFVRPVGDHLVGATLYDGIVVEPKMVEAAESHPVPASSVR